MNRKGEIRMSRRVFERLGSPVAVQVLFDAANGTIGVQPTSPAMPDAFHVSFGCKKTGQRHVNAMATVVQFGLQIPETIRFYDAHIDHDTTLILDLRTARVDPRVKNHWSNRDRKATG